MSAIKLYNSKSEALYFKDSKRNSFYEFGGIQLLPKTTYTQKSSGIELGNRYSVTAYSVDDNSYLGVVSITNVKEELNGDEVYADSTSIRVDNTALRVDSYLTGNLYWSIISESDFGNELLYLKFTYNGESYYSSPLYITALDEDRVTKFTYKDLASNEYQSIGLKTWFRQKSRQSELTVYYESSTKNTVTQNVKTNNLELYESEFMSMDDLIMTAEILESPYLYAENRKYSLFESVKIPELTQQENFGKIKFTLAPNKITTPTTSLSISELTYSSFRYIGQVLSEGNVLGTSYGVVYGTSKNPTIFSSTKILENKLLFTNVISGLSQNTTYYIRTYATNETGTYYGTESFVTTLEASVVIGTQTWSLFNLDVATYRNGDTVPQVTDPTAWGTLTTGAWCWYDNSSSNGTTYGKLYNWYAVNDSRGLAPVGYHIPTATEFNTLSTFLGGNTISGGKMKATGTSLWYPPNTGATNSSGFTGVPSGQRDFSGGFTNIQEYMFTWSKTDSGGNAAFYSLSTDNASLYTANSDKKYGMAVRLIKD